jgi:hypothetical protein
MTETGTLVKDHAPSRVLIEQRCILVEGSGVLDISFENALNLFSRENLLEDAQAAYAAMLPEGESPEFVIQHVASNRYAYVNRKKEKCEITEVVRSAAPEGEATLVYHTIGRRWFGLFESLTHIEAAEGEGGKLAYKVRAYCYPHGKAARVVARLFSVVHIYFRNKTEAVTAIVRRIALHLLEHGPSRAVHRSPSLG